MSNATGGERLELGLLLATWADQSGASHRWHELRELARLAEEVGLDALWLADHVAIAPGWPFRETWTTLSAIAASTGRIRIGTLVTCTAFRSPVLLASMADMVDEIAGGRLVLGLGAGYPEGDQTWAALGLHTDRPIGRFEEAVQIVIRLLRERELDFEGQFYTLRGVRLALPRAPGRPIPIWIGAGGRRMMRITARWVDAFNTRVRSGAEAAIEEDLRLLEEACSAVGRDPSTLARTALGMVSFVRPNAARSRYSDPARREPFAGTPDEIAAQLDDLRRFGFRHMACIVDPGMMPGPLRQYVLLTSRSIEQLGRVAESLRSRAS